MIEKTRIDRVKYYMSLMQASGTHAARPDHMPPDLRAALGGRTSHAAVVARHLGKVCLVGCSSLQVDEVRRRCSFGARRFVEGDVITLDGESGRVYAGAVPSVTERPEAALTEVRLWHAPAR
jgi:pyruvate,orthophosphate dikinase